MHYLLISLGLALLLSACGDSSQPEPVQETTAASTESVENRGSDASGGNWWDGMPRPEWGEYERLDTGQDWFEVYRIEPGILAIYEPGQFEEVISWLILGEDRALLFDTGLGIGDIRSLVASLTDLPLMPLNSHSHYDHSGGNYQFEAVMGVDTPYTRNRARGTPNESVAEFASEGWIWKDHPPGFDPATYSIQPWQHGTWVEDRQFIDLGNVSLEVVFAPGHAPDCIVLIDHQRRLMFTGDVFYPAPLYTHIPGSSFKDYLASSRRLADLEEQVDYLMPSHNVPRVSSEYLTRMRNAFESIKAGSAEFELSDGAREYRFEGFGVLTHNPPDIAEGNPQ